MMRWILLIASTLITIDLFAATVTANLYDQRGDIGPSGYMLRCKYSYQNEVFDFEYKINSRQYLDATTFGEILCPNTQQVQLKHRILGSSAYWDRDKVEVVSDVKVGSLRLRHAKVDGCSHLEIEGRIDNDSIDVILALIPEISPCLSYSDGVKSFPIYLNSFGGYLENGIQLGKLFRSMRIKTIVIDDQVCASACSIAFLGGYSREISGNGKLLLHAPYYQTGNSYSCAGSNVMNQLKVYLQTMLPESAANISFKRMQEYCDPNGGWIVNKDGAKIFKMTNS